MTRRRYDSHGTEFGNWIREQDDLRSSYGYTATDLDYVWRNYKNSKWMMIEEKRKMSKMRRAQSESHRFLDGACKANNHYFGFHLLQFENTCPEDGKIYWNTWEITKAGLINNFQMLTRLPGYFDLAATGSLSTQQQQTQ